MLSISNEQDVGDRILAAAATCVRDYGIDRVTLAEIARRAKVSRPTIYRRWPDTQAILAALLTRRITEAAREVPLAGPGRTAIVDRIVAVAARLRHDDLLSAVLHSAPEFAMVYIAERLGTSQRLLIDVLADDLRAAQADGSVRAGDPRRLATMVLLVVQSTIQSAQIVEPILPPEELATELTHALNGYLAHG
ncbi:TetR/AcrR family transcriptional regulator [Mycolicibacterium confluentis]|uniref:Putative HTH-type transcriptional regulator n=1 Tax=Mycolicibacterium confluentis TaxID=28047 RepID=A0A7I7XVA0_9MYCO|nr:TetR/AcrR family transcriptional regulator [Mycolicibacterium confluentis]MCV7318058.1 TetR/AcrR family transcriptional regulator [Mycolicibacterium confluentis]ORV32515.1 TetR family transcriptional regulator [Mycolicibacterium confluentis]BBZ33081.1 putative HTH-type transcriptional regulator [Mycolicibacterium confluentis]